MARCLGSKIFELFSIDERWQPKQIGLTDLQPAISWPGPLAGARL